jgi:hypothetical protein
MDKEPEPDYQWEALNSLSDVSVAQVYATLHLATVVQGVAQELDYIGAALQRICENMPG